MNKRILWNQQSRILHYLVKVMYINIIYSCLKSNISVCFLKLLGALNVYVLNMLCVEHLFFLDKNGFRPCMVCIVW
jgi:hypothetical protein